MRFVISALFFLVFFSYGDAYDPLDPTGNITIKWNVMSWTPDGYVHAPMQGQVWRVLAGHGGFSFKTTTATVSSAGPVPTAKHDTHISSDDDDSDDDDVPEGSSWGENDEDKDEENEKEEDDGEIRNL